MIQTGKKYFAEICILLHQLLISRLFYLKSWNSDEWFNTKRNDLIEKNLFE